MKKTAIPVILIFVVSGLYAGQTSIGPRINTSDEFYLGLKLACQLDNELLPFPIFSIDYRPYTQNRLFQVNTNEYYQLREHAILFQLGIEEDVPVTSGMGLTGGISLGILGGWYNGSDREYVTKCLPVASFGVYKVIDTWKIELNYRYADIRSKTPHGILLSVEFLL